MKRDWELIRAVLLDLEEPGQADLSAWSESQIGYHRLQILKAGLATGFDSTALDSEHGEAVLDDLTPAGHDFLQAARIDTVWNRAVAAVKAHGTPVAIRGFMEFLFRALRGEA